MFYLIMLLLTKSNLTVYQTQSTFKNWFNVYISRNIRGKSILDTLTHFKFLRCQYSIFSTSLSESLIISKYQDTQYHIFYWFYLIGADRLWWTQDISIYIVSFALCPFIVEECTNVLSVPYNT